MFNLPGISRYPRRRGPMNNLTFTGFPHGLNTSVPAGQLVITECSELLNFKVNKAGQLETRRPITVYTNSATASNASVKTFAKVNVNGTDRELLVDANYKLDYLDGSLDPTNIGTLEGDAQIVSYKGVALILDGSYIKYIDGVSAIKLAYDDGTGTSAYQFDNRGGDDDTHTDLGNGTNTRVAYKFTSQTWSTGYTIPPTTVYASIKRAGNGYTGADTTDITVRIRKVADDSVMAAKTFVASPLATNVSSVATTEYSVTFAASDITTELGSNTAYYVSLEYDNGDATHHIEVHASTVASGGTGYYYDGSWHAEATKDPLVGLKPGKPPKGAFGEVHKQRPFVGGDPDNPGYVWFGNLTYLDWSTPDGGGYVGAVDDDSNTFGVGGIKSFYGDLYVFGKQDQPYLAKLTGDTPDDYALPYLYQKAWTAHKVLKDSVNDIWFCSADGFDTLTGVQEYGDLRTFSYSDPVKDRIEDYWSTTTAMAAYQPETGQMWFYMPSYHRCLIAHTHNKAVSPDGQGVRYPWTEYELYRDVLTDTDTYKWTASGSGTNEYYCEAAAGGDPSFDAQPDFITMGGTKLTEGTAGSLSDHEWDYADNDTLGYSTVYVRDNSGDPDTSGVEIRSVLGPTCLAQAGGDFFIGGSDGYVYKYDTTKYRELESHRITYNAKTGYVPIPFGRVRLNKQQIGVASQKGGQVVVSIYKDDEYNTADASYTYTLSMDDRLTLDDLTGVNVEDAYFAADPSANPMYRRMALVARTLMVEVADIIVAGSPIYINSLTFRMRMLSS